MFLMLVKSCRALSALYTFTSAVTSTHCPRSLSFCPLLTVHCVISGSFQCDTEICKSALLVLSISDRIILKQRAACLPVCPLLLPWLIKLTEALHIRPQQLLRAFPQYHNQQRTLSISKPVCYCQVFDESRGKIRFVLVNQVKAGKLMAFLSASVLKEGCYSPRYVCSV